VNKLKPKVLKNLLSGFPTIGNFKHRFSNRWKLFADVFPIIGNFSNHWKISFAALALLIAAAAPCSAAPETTDACWTSTSHRVFFPVNEPVFLSDDYVLLLQRGNHDYTFFLPVDHQQHPSRNYPLALISAPLTIEQQQTLADLFCAQGWAMLHLDMPRPNSPEDILAGLIAVYRDATKRYPILPNTQLLAGYQTGAEVGAFFAATRKGFAAWIGDDGLFPRDAKNGDVWITDRLNSHADLLLYALQREPQTTAVTSFQETLPEDMELQTAAINATNPPLPIAQINSILASIRKTLLFERPADGRHYYYAQAEYERLRNRLTYTDDPQRTTILREMNQLNQYYHFEADPE
jgi:hypothetical protein